MNLISYILLVLVAAATGYGIFRTIKRKGRCACCDGSCPGCQAGGAYCDGSAGSCRPGEPDPKTEKTGQESPAEGK